MVVAEGCALLHHPMQPNWCRGFQRGSFVPPKAKRSVMVQSSCPPPQTVREEIAMIVAKDYSIGPAEAVALGTDKLFAMHDCMDFKIGPDPRGNPWEDCEAHWLSLK
jgi:hypothetical protein